MNLMRVLPGWKLWILTLGLITLEGVLFILPSSSRQTSTNQVKTEDVLVGISPETTNLKKGERESLVITIRSEKEVSALDLRLKFDPRLVKVEDVVPLGFFKGAKVLAKNIDNNKGETSFDIGGLPARSGSGNLAQITVTALSPGEAKIGFTQDSRVAAVGQRGNVLSATSDAVIKIEKK